MRHPKIIIAGIGVAVLATAGGLTAASASSTPAPSAMHSAASTSTTSGAATAHTATVRTATATVAGKTETILVSSRGLPLYYYRPDTATKSLVTGGLAALWPPLTAAAPVGSGLSGKLAVLSDVNGRQVTYNGHPLYTFADDHSGQVTGQGVSDFFVATPGLATLGLSAPAAPAAPASGGYGY